MADYEEWKNSDTRSRKIKIIRVITTVRVIFVHSIIMLLHYGNYDPNCLLYTLRKTIAGLEQKLQKKDFVISSYVTQINLLKNDAQVVDQLRKENKTLKQQIHTMEGVSAILTAGAADADRLLKNENNPHVLANWVTTLKRELRQCETKKTELRNVVKVVQNDLRKELDLKRLAEENLL